MAQRGRPLDERTRREVVRLREVLSVRKTARETGTSRNTVRKYTRRGDGR
jgi:DNA invertase Pin-like site-specific DNA recombinase